MRFDGKVVVVTGAGAVGEGWGNGRATSVAYAREGAQLVLVDRDQAALDATAQLVRDAGRDCATVVVDASTVEGVDEIVDTTTAAFGSVDVLQANLGIGSIGGLLECRLSRWELLFRVNVTSLFLAAQAFVPLMARRGGGAIVNVSSIASVRSVGQPFAAYSSSKAAANQLVRAMAVEFAADNVRCNSVIVGYVDTPTVALAYRDLAPEAHAALQKTRIDAVPLQRMGTAWDVAAASVFLASDDAQFVTGTEIVVDGGMTNVAG